MYRLTLFFIAITMLGCAIAPKPEIKKTPLSPEQAALCKKDCFDDRVACYNRAEQAWRCETTYDACVQTCKP